MMHSALVQIWSWMGRGCCLGSGSGHNPWAAELITTWVEKMGVDNCKWVRWTPSQRQCNTDFEGFDNRFSGDGGKGKSPRLIDIRLMSVLEVVRQLVVVLIVDGASGKMWQCCVLVNHLSPFSVDFGG